MTTKRKLSPEQKHFCRMIAENSLKHPAERVSVGALYLEAGYQSKTPAQHGATAIRKPHLEKEIARLTALLKGEQPPDDANQSEAQWAYENLKKLAPKSPSAAAQLLEHHRKKEADGGGVDVVPVLLSPFLTEQQLDEFRSATPQDVVVATEHKPPEVDKCENAKENDDCE